MIISMLYNIYGLDGRSSLVATSLCRIRSTVVVHSGLVTTHPLKADLQSLRDKFDTLIVDAQWYCGSHPLNSPRENLRLIGTL